MFKRVIYMGVGAAAGSAGTLWAQRKVKDKLNDISTRASPGSAAAVVSQTAKNVAGTLQSAVVEGRAAMRQAEAEMRSSVDIRTPVERSKLRSDK